MLTNKMICEDHFAMYTDTELLYFTLETVICQLNLNKKYFKKICHFSLKMLILKFMYVYVLASPLGLRDFVYNLLVYPPYLKVKTTKKYMYTLVYLK